MADAGKIEGRITVPTAGWAVALTDQSGGPTTITIPAGTYYHSSAGSEAEDFAATIATLANAAMTQTWTCTVAAGESASGKYTISCTGSTCTVTFTDTEVRDIMGYTGNLSGSTSYASTNQAKGLFLPTRPFHNANGGGSWRGGWETNLQGQENPSGHFHGVMGRKKRVMRLAWNAEPRRKAWVANETTTGESWEQFLIDCIWAGESYFDVAGPVRWYPDAAIDGVYGTYSVPVSEYNPEQFTQDSTFAWRIVINRMIEEPS